MSKPSPISDVGIGQFLARASNPGASVSERVAEWQGCLSELVLPVRAEVDFAPGEAPVVGDFRASLRLGRFGPSGWLAIDASAQILHRGPEEIAAGTGPWLFVSTMTRGHGWLNARGRRELVETGQTVFVDSAQSYSLEFDADFAFVSAMLPRADLLALQPHAPGAHASKVREPVGAALHSFLKSLANPADLAENEPWGNGRRLYDHFVGLVLSAIEPIALASASDPASSQQILLSRIQSSLLAALPQRHLTSAWIAERFGLSVRQVQRLFQSQGTTVARWLLGQRLERCAEALADPVHANLTIGDIAQHWGFSDLSYFSRCFSRRYGVQPGQFREARAMPEPAAEGWGTVS